MRSTWMKVTIGVIGIVALGSILIGVASPDGSVRDTARPVNQGPSATTTAPSDPAPTGSATDPSPSDEQEPGPDLAPAAVTGSWAGLPDGVEAAGDDTDWCGAVTTSGASEAERVFGRGAVDAAACAAVGFVLNHRYSRLSLPRRSYSAADFDPVLPALDDTTASRVYRPRIASFVASPSSDTVGEQLGLVLFTGRGTAKGAQHVSAGAGHVFYGTAFSRDGYRDRAAWINPTWSSVAIRVDRSTSEPRIEARLTASAAVPVWSTTTSSDAMLTVPTRATFTLRRDGDDWHINGWTISRGDVSYAPLTVR